VNGTWIVNTGRRSLIKTVTMNTAQLQIKRFLSFNSSVRHDITKLINCQTVESRDCRL